MKTFTGTVQRGSRRASALGYPTINLSLGDQDISGVYAARVALPGGEVREAAAFADPSRKLLEAHIFGYDRDIYGQIARIQLHKKIRESESFTDDEVLKQAIARDVAAVREYFDHA